MSKCGAETEVYSRVVGYHRPVKNWNKGKREEFKDRKIFSLPSSSAAVLFLMTFLLLTGCGTTEQLAEGISEKSISGSGTVSIQRVGLDPQTGAPVLRSTVITGDYASAKGGEVAFQYRRKKSPSVFNADAISEEVVINYIGSREDLAEAEKLAEQDMRDSTEDSPPSQGAESTPVEPASAGK